MIKLLTDNGGILGTDELAEELGMTEEAVEEWGEESGVPRVSGVLVFREIDVMRLIADQQAEEDDELEEDEDEDEDEDEYND